MAGGIDSKAPPTGAAPEHQAASRGSGAFVTTFIAGAAGLAHPTVVKKRRVRACYLPHVRARDTSPRAAAIQNELHDRLGPEGRVELAMRMSELAREFAKAGMRAQQPMLTEAEMLRELARVFYGR